MPTYSYVCKSCAHAFDAQQSIHDEALKTCPECKGELRKVLGEVGVTFKGSGFYRTDNATPKTD
jgi:putative FmdB family regulatory protein